MRIINKQAKDIVPVDACIANEIQFLNDLNIVTLGCCCGHGKAGQIVEWENGFGQWRGYVDPPHCLIDEQSIEEVRSLGYRPIPYCYADGIQNEVWKIYLKTGCIAQDECDSFEV
ncbi:hypothetical protein IFU39_16330 [Paenibacillus sp. CFBP 13594]|uniref:hypothetical protein n=1 Tax=Paenibacillus sp. CFBP 13594 TaxID=2774037 RepID=UPI00177E1640|nr:hypothetical protein [Paenibacillus sp. CFBP 13594]MBD8839380.1 hypothetical protein [Paenibacillus sp. CFBP 13594]